jgi:3-oxoacyl-[acyl-carrier protein] reductase
VSDRVAVVTGGGGGIGAAVCEALADTATVVVLDIDAGKAERAAQRVQELGGHAVAIRCDVSSEREVDTALSAIARDQGAPAILVHAAGYGGPFHTVDEVSHAEWARIVGTNLTSAFSFSKWLLPKMKDAGFGRLVFIASVQGLVGARLSSAYVASKHGLVGLARALAAEWGEFGITSNAICPGYVNTTMGPQPDARAGHAQRILDRTPSRRIAEPAEVAALVRYVVSLEARHMNGATIVLDGGITADLGI